MAAEPKHDLLAHIEAGGFGIYAPECPRCEADGRYVRTEENKGHG